MSVQRYCFWHIIKLMKQKQYKFFKDRKGLYRELKQAIRDSFTPEEFEARWREIIDRYNVHDNNGLNFLCNIRSYWVSAFFMEEFYPFSSTTGRSESTNSPFKGYVTHKDTIVNFFVAYENIHEKNLSELDRGRLNSEVKDPNKWFESALEKHASEIFTNALFRKI
jgi:hypothetical protein